jgi:maleate isomerase/arylmalonate decarboxylase
MSERRRRPTVYGRRARLGVIVPPTNTANEAEWNRTAPEGVSVHSTRMRLHGPGSTESELRADLARHAAELAEADADVIAYGCTAGSLTVPATVLAEFMERTSGRPCITTAQALVEALRALGVQRVALATPYHDALNAHEAAFLAAHAIDTVACRGLGLGAGGVHEYRAIALVEPEAVFAHAVSADTDAAQAVLVSCTDFATLGVIERLEQTLGKPAVSSNQATFWLALRRAGIADRLDGHGRLLREH